MNTKNYTFKAALIFSLALLMNTSLWAQSPEKMSYQAVIRDSEDILITNAQVGMQISILQGSTNGTVVYSETQAPTTNTNGLVSIEIGGGTGFSTIDWASGIYFIKSETDPSGGTNYSITGTSQLLSVPYALHAKTAESITGAGGVINGNVAGDMLYWNGTEWAIVVAGNEGDILTFLNNKPTWSGGSGIGTVQNPTTGAIWMDRNLGASQVATSSADTQSYGDLYQWGRGADGHENRTSETTTTRSNSDNPGHGNFILNPVPPSDWRNPGNDNLWQGGDGINNPCPDGFRIPTVVEWEAELLSWESENSVGAFGSPLKLPVAGLRHHDNGALNMVGSGGFYWTSTTFGDQVRTFGFSDGSAYAGADRRGFGFSVRCIKD